MSILREIILNKRKEIDFFKKNNPISEIEKSLFFDREVISLKKSLIEKIPMGQIGSAEDVAYCVEFLVSEKSKYITGQTIHINGGLAML